ARLRCVDRVRERDSIHAVALSGADDDGTKSDAQHLVVLARDGTGRELVAARVEPNSKQCFRWPFIHAIGYLVAAESPHDTLTTEPFQPWSADGWEWSGQLEPKSNPNACR